MRKAIQHAVDTDSILDAAYGGVALTFESEPLADKLELLGAPVVEIELSVDRPVASLAAWLSDVAPGGEATRISYGLLNLNHRNGHAEPEPLAAGERYRVRLQLNDLGQSVPHGHRLRLSLSSAYWPMVWPSPEPVSLTVYTGASVLELPERPSRAEDELIPAFAEPESARPMPHTAAIPYSRGRTIRRDVESGVTVIDVTKDRGRIHLHGPGLLYAGKGTERFEIRDGNPLSAKAETHYTVLIERAPWRTRTETHTTMSATESDFLISAALDAFEDDVRVFSRTWDAKIPRDFN